MQVISVKPVPGGWAVETHVSLYPLVFLSGREAERKARQLAETVAGQGADVEVRIHDRQSAPIGSFAYAAARWDAGADGLR